MYIIYFKDVTQLLFGNIDKDKTCIYPNKKINIHLQKI